MFAGDFYVMRWKASCFHRLVAVYTSVRPRHTNYTFLMCVRTHIHTPTRTLRPTSSSLAHLDSLLWRHIGKPLVLIMLYRHVFPLVCLVITILCVCERVRARYPTSM